MPTLTDIIKGVVTETGVLTVSVEELTQQLQDSIDVSDENALLMVAAALYAGGDPTKVVTLVDGAVVDNTLVGVHFTTGSSTIWDTKYVTGTLEGVFDYTTGIGTGLSKTLSLAQVSGSSIGDNSVIRTNPNTVTQNLTIPTGINGSTVGPVTIEAGASVTVEADATWVVI